MSRSSIFSFESIRAFRPKLDKLFALVVVAVVAVEVGLRVAVRAGSSNQYVRAVREIALKGYYPAPHVFDPECGYVYKRNYVGRLVSTDYDTLMVTNNHGFRGPDFDAVKPEGVYRVALLGDSLLAANEVAIEETWAYQLERQLGRIQGKRVEILNLGTDGYNLWNILKLSERVLPAFDVDAVVLWYHQGRMLDGNERYRLTVSANNILECHNAGILLQRAVFEARESMSLRLLIPRELLVSRLLNHLCKKVGPPSIRRIEGESRVVREPVDILAAIRATCDSVGVPFGVFYRRDRPLPESDMCPGLGIPTWSDELAVPDYSVLRWEHDAHFSVPGNALYAEKVAPVFQEMLEQMADDEG